MLNFKSNFDFIKSLLITIYVKYYILFKRVSIKLTLQYTNIWQVQRFFKCSNLLLIALCIVHIFTYLILVLNP